MSEANDILESPMSAELQIAGELAGRVSSATVIRRHEPMAKHTTLRVGGAADFFVEPGSEEDLAAVLKYCAAQPLKFFILGRGSNLLVRDGGFRGVVICLRHPEFSRIEVQGEHLRCGAGARLKHVAIEARRNGLSGLEFFEGIPGSIGGALRMNAGAMTAATFEVVESVRVMDFAGDVRELTPAEMSVDYRCCATLKDHVALSALLKGRQDSVESIAQRMLVYGRKRWTSQPAAPSARISGMRVSAPENTEKPRALPRAVAWRPMRSIRLTSLPFLRRRSGPMLSNGVLEFSAKCLAIPWLTWLTWGARGRA